MNKEEQKPIRNSGVRDEGFYWIKYWGYSKWEIAEWKENTDWFHGYYWHIRSQTNGRDDSSLFKINELRILNPDDQCDFYGLVSHPEIYYGNEIFKVTGVRENELELEGDWSGGTHCVNQRSWFKKDGIILHSKIKEKS